MSKLNDGRARRATKKTRKTPGGRGYHPALTHAERRERRGKIAAIVRDSGRWAGVQKACKTFGVSVSQVRSACAEHGVAMPAPEKGGR